MTYLLYARVSPKGSAWAVSESSIAVQLDACRQHVLRLDPRATFLEVADEFQSGRDTRRPGFQRILRDLERRAGDWDVLCVYSLDRLGRSIADMLPFFESLHKAGRGLLSVRQNIDMATAGGRAMLYMLCVFAQLEREMNSERTLAKMMGIAAGGGIPYGRPPYGYRRGPAHDNVLQVDPEAAAKVRQAFDLYGAGRSLGQVVTATGLAPKAILKMLRREIYAGVIAYNGHAFQGRHEALVTRDLWDRVQSRLPKGNPRGAGAHAAGRPNSRTYPYLLAGLVRCHCGMAMSPYSVLRRRKASQTRYHYYKCPGCRNAISASLLDGEVLEHVRETPVTRASAQRFLEQMQRHTLAAQQQTAPRLAEIARELPAARARLNAATDVFFQGQVTPDNAAHYNAAMTRARQAVEALETEERDLLARTAQDLPDLDQTMALLAYWGDMLAKCDTEDTRRAFLQARVARVTIAQDGTVALGMVMTKGSEWRPSWELVITWALAASRPVRG